MNLLVFTPQFLTFLTILSAGFTYIVLGWLFSHILGDHADAHSDGDTGDVDHNHETVSIFSPKVVAIFMVGFGAGGSIATSYAIGALGATLTGLGVGALFGTAGLGFMRALYAQQATSCIPMSAAVGQPATVSSDIPVGGTGEVSLSVNGQYMTYFARSVADTAISLRRGSTVTVVALQGTTLIVK